MIHYINYEKKKLCGRNNQPNVIPLIIDYSTVENVSFQFIDCNNRILDISGLSGLYFAGSIGMGQQSCNLLFLSKDYTIADNVLTFSVDTYTVPYLAQIKKKQTVINIEIGQTSLDAKKVLMRETALANPRVYTAGLSPQEIDSHDYWTIEETQQAIDKATSGLASIEYVDDAISGATSGAATKTYVDEQDEALSGAIDGLSSSKQDVIDEEHKLDYGLLSATPTIPTAVSQLTNDAEYATSGYVDAQLSSKADESALTAHTSNTSIHTTSDEKEVWNSKQDNIDSSHKLDYGLISGAPTIPTKTSDLTNDSDYATSAYVQEQVSGKADASALEDYQKKITAEEKLDYALLSGTPTIPLSTSQLVNDSGFVEEAALDDYQEKLTAENKLDYALLSGTFPYDPVNVTLEMKTATTAGTFTGSFEGKQIQKWVYTDATSGTITIAFDAFSSTATDIAPTIEMHIGLNGNVSTITLPASLNIVDIPDSLTYNGQTASDIDYHVFVLRAERDMNAAWKFYINYAYDYIETIA